jgi:hypothetical protein
MELEPEILARNEEVRMNGERHANDSTDRTPLPY